MNYDGKTIKLYVNGILAGTTPYTTKVGVGNSSNAVFGRMFVQDFPYYVVGMIDDAAIWNRALTDEEITNLYTSTTSGNVGININSPQRNLHVKDVIRLEPRNQAPGNPGEGDIYYDGVLHRLRLFDGTTWQNL